MRSSPRKRVGAVSCGAPVTYSSEYDMARTPVGELRHEAIACHHLKIGNTMKKPEVINCLKEHFTNHHGVNIKKTETSASESEENQDPSSEIPDNHPVSETIDRLRNRIQNKKEGKSDSDPPERDGEVIESAERLLELAQEVLGPGKGADLEVHSGSRGEYRQGSDLEVGSAMEVVNDVTESVVTSSDDIVEKGESEECLEEEVVEECHPEEVVYEEVIADSEETLVYTNHHHQEEEVSQQQEQDVAHSNNVHYEEAVQIVPTEYQDPIAEEDIVYQEDLEDNSDSNLAIDYGDYGEEVSRNTVLSVSEEGEHIQYEVVSQSVTRMDYPTRPPIVADSNRGLEVSTTFDDGQYYSEPGDDVIIQVMPKVICNAYVIASTVKELKDLGRDMLRVHAENHGIEQAIRMKMPELLKEVIEHYNQVHDAGLQVNKLDMLKLNMIQLKKVRVQVREKTPPPDTSKMIPKNVVPIEEQVHHVYEKRPDVCAVDIIVNNLKDMLALGTSILRPEASKHRVANSSRKQKLQVVEELWEHYLKFHLKQTEASDVQMALERKDIGMVEETPHVSYEEEVEKQYVYDTTNIHESDYIVVREEDLVQGDDIQTIAEEVTA